MTHKPNLRQCMVAVVGHSVARSIEYYSMPRSDYRSSILREFNEREEERVVKNCELIKISFSNVKNENYLAIIINFDAYHYHHVALIFNTYPKHNNNISRHSMKLYSPKGKCLNLLNKSCLLLKLNLLKFTKETFMLLRIHFCAVHHFFSDRKNFRDQSA